MTESGAGERARELAAAWADEWYKTQPNLYDYLEGKLAGALAAVRLEEARRWIGNMHSHEKPWPGCDHCAYLVALERAVEGK